MPLQSQGNLTLKLTYPRGGLARQHPSTKTASDASTSLGSLGSPDESGLNES